PSLLLVVRSRLHLYLLLRALPAFPTRRSSDLGDFDELSCRRVSRGPSHSVGARGRPAVRRLRPQSGESPRGDSSARRIGGDLDQDRKSTRLNSSHGSISYAVFCWKKKIHTLLA